jgi:hypothetical protein
MTPLCRLGETGSSKRTLTSRKPVSRKENLGKAAPSTDIADAVLPLAGVGIGLPVRLDRGEDALTVEERRLRDLRSVRIKLAALR